MNRKRINITVPEVVLEKFDRIVEKKFKSRSAVITELISDYTLRELGIPS